MTAMRATPEGRSALSRLSGVLRGVTTREERVRALRTPEGIEAVSGYRDQYFAARDKINGQGGRR